jgi:phosphopantothenoylcysteine synthetase/decarboxylase
MSFKVNMTKNLSYTESYAATLLLELKEKQVPQISNRTNKKRKKDNSSGLEEKAHKKIKAKQNDDKHDDDDDDKHDDDDDDKHDDEYMIFRYDRVQINKNWYSSFNKVKKYINNKKKMKKLKN